MNLLGETVYILMAFVIVQILVFRRALYETPSEHGVRRRARLRRECSTRSCAAFSYTALINSFEPVYITQGICRINKLIKCSQVFWQSKYFFVFYLISNCIRELVSMNYQKWSIVKLGYFRRQLVSDIFLNYVS